MPTYITYNIINDDSIKLFLSDSIVVGLCDREDFSALSEIEEVHRPGIYVLLDGAKRYVGQATVGIHGRLNTHDKSKDWWSKLVFIAHAYGALSPDKLNYLEAKLIHDFTNLGYVMDNGNKGNQNSYIATPQKIEAEKFLHDALEGLDKIGQINLYQKPKGRFKNTIVKKEQTSINEHSVEGNNTKRKNRHFIDSLGNEFEANTLGGQNGIYTQWLKKLAENPSVSSKLFELARTSRASLLKVSEIDPSPPDKSFYAKITDRLWAYVILSSKHTIENFDEISEYLEITYVLEELRLAEEAKARNSSE